MPETKCGFCEELKKQKNLDDEVGYSKSSSLARIYSVTLVIETFADKKKVLGGTSCFEYFPLNYCPECGARMDGDKK